MSGTAQIGLHSYCSLAVGVQVMDAIEGRNGQALPWEGAGLTPVNRRKLGIVRESLMALLVREPSRRPSMATFCDSCDRVLAGSTTITV